MANNNLQQQLEQMINKKVEEMLATKMQELQKQIIAEIKSTYMVEPHIKVKEMVKKA